MKKLLYSVLLLFFAIACQREKGQIIYTLPSENSGFNFPYYLYLPEGISEETKLTLIVEPNNSGFASDDLDEHSEKAKRQVTKDYYLGNYVARKLKYPLLVPVFPRPKEQWKIYTHALDRDVIVQKDNALERIDLQLIAMMEDAKKRLADEGYTITEKVLMTGFSASATFVNRFSIIHPEKVLACAAGGLNGLLMLPVNEIRGYQLSYPVGTSDFEANFGKPFDSVGFYNLPQFLFMGEMDENDAIPFEDGYDPEEREVIYTVLGQEMQPARWNNCTEIYQDHQVNAQIKTFTGIGHEHPEHVKLEIVEFFRSNIEE